jgi:hypothetical protein
MEKEQKLADKTDVFESEIAPLVQQLKEACEKHDVPMLTTVQINQDRCMIVYLQHRGETPALSTAFHVIVHRDSMRSGLFSVGKG